MKRTCLLASLTVLIALAFCTVAIAADRGGGPIPGWRLMFSTGHQIVGANLTSGDAFEAVTPGAGYEGMPKVSPDGKFTAFLSTRDGMYAVWAVDNVSGRLKKLFNSPWTQDFCWSPDSRYIYISDGQIIMKYDALRGGVHQQPVIVVDGSWDEEAISPHTYKSEDGQEILLFVRTGGYLVPMVVEKNLATGVEEEVLSECGAYDAVLTPPGWAEGWLVFANCRDQLLWRWQLGSVEAPEPITNRQLWDPTISPGGYIYATGQTSNYQFHVFQVDTSGTVCVDVTPNVSWAADPEVGIIKGPGVHLGHRVRPR